MTLFEIVGLYVALNLFLLATLTLRVGMVRMKKKINLGDGGDARMNQRIRAHGNYTESCLLYTSPSPRDQRGSRMPSSA